MVRRAAFTLIELIFAIVVIGLVSLSVPMILVNNSRSVEQNLMQEAILIASTKAGQVLTYPWDENSRDPGSGVLAKTDALNINDATFEDELDRNISDYRKGHFQQALRRKLTPENAERNATDDTLLGFDAGDLGAMDDIDDFNEVSTVITHIGEDNYKNDYNITTRVVYIEDEIDYDTNVTAFSFSTAALNRPTNIKMIEVDVAVQDTAGIWQPTVLLRSFSSNIGETDYYKRTY